jgi:hypothetical protein
MASTHEANLYTTTRGALYQYQVITEFAGLCGKTGVAIWTRCQGIDRPAPGCLSFVLRCQIVLEENTSAALINLDDALMEELDRLSKSAHAEAA